MGAKLGLANRGRVIG